MQRYGLRVVVAVAAAAALLSACGRKDSPTPIVQTPTTPTPPASPEPPSPPPPDPQPCAFALTADPDDFGPEGGNTTLRVTTGSGCAWTVRIDASWLVVEGPSSGEGSGAVRLVASANDSPASRRATVSVGDATFTIAQDARSQTNCSYQVAPVAATLPRIAWTGEVSIATSPGCAWTASSTAPWLRLRQGGGNGTGTLTYDADFNPQGGYAERRAGVIEVRWAAPTAGQNVRVTQWGDCSMTASPATGGLPAGATYSGSRTAGTLTAGAQGGRVHFWVLTDPFMGCAWSAESSDTWIAWTSPRIHQVMSGDGDLVFTVPAKTGSDTRRAAVTLGGGFTLTIVQ